jgi:hypothetical protein
MSCQRTVLLSAHPPRPMTGITDLVRIRLLLPILMVLGDVAQLPLCRGGVHCAAGAAAVGAYEAIAAAGARPG